MFSGFKSDRNTIDTLRDYIDRKLIAYNNPRYTYMVINKRNPVDIFIVTSYPNEWADFYITNNYQHITVLSDLKSSKICALSKKYNIVNGFTFVLHDNMNNLAMLSLILDDEAQKGLEGRVVDDRERLQMLLIETHEKMLTLSQKKNHQPDRKRVETPAKDIFSPRENEVLHWASMGKTYHEVALIIGITPRTVKYHMGNVVKKLGVINAKQAIRLGVELELIKSLPQ
jgi:LuxR family quorum-sensing system transcriptional regulator ExpR